MSSEIKFFNLSPIDHKPDQKNKGWLEIYNYPESPKGWEFEYTELKTSEDSVTFMEKYEQKIVDYIENCEILKLMDILDSVEVVNPFTNQHSNYGTIALLASKSKDQNITRHVFNCISYLLEKNYFRLLQKYKDDARQIKNEKFVSEYRMINLLKKTFLDAMTLGAYKCGVLLPDTFKERIEEL